MLLALAFTFAPYALQTFDGQTHPAELATLVVPERAGSARMIELAVIRLRSTAATPGVPTVFLSPGPGIAASVLGRVPPYFALFDRLRAVGDVILLDARGEGMSKPNLDRCPAGELPAQPFESEAALLAAVAGSVKHCADYWRGQGVDLGAYSTDARADDVEALRKALGVERVNLVAFSYGTEVALNLIRRHSASVGRVALAATDSGVWDHPNLPATFDTQLRKLAALSNKDLPAIATSVLARLDQHPIEVSIKDAARPLRVGKAALQLVLATKLPDANGAAMIPALLNGLQAGDTSVLQPLVQQLAAALRTGITLVGRAIDCNTPLSDARRRLAAEQAPRSVVGNMAALHLDPRVCAAALGAKPPRKDVPPPLVSSVPVLFISGDLDANAPPFYAEQIRWGLPASRHVIVINGFHETLPDAKVQAIVADFLAGNDIGSPVVTFRAPSF